MWSFVGKKANKPWIWMAMDANPHQVIAFHVGDRSRESAQGLWANIPVVYREQARFHTDQYEAYKGVIPAERHKAITKTARKTNHVERFNNTLRQRVSHLVRETGCLGATEHKAGLKKVWDPKVPNHLPF
jgi:insertion element IS1 protein InsB